MTPGDGAQNGEVLIRFENISKAFTVRAERNSWNTRMTSSSVS